LKKAESFAARGFFTLNKVKGGRDNKEARLSSTYRADD